VFSGAKSRAFWISASAASAWQRRQPWDCVGRAKCRADRCVQRGDFSARGCFKVRRRNRAFDVRLCGDVSGLAGRWACPRWRSCRRGAVGCACTQRAMPRDVRRLAFLGRVRVRSGALGVLGVLGVPAPWAGRGAVSGGPGRRARGQVLSGATWRLLAASGGGIWCACGVRGPPESPKRPGVGRPPRDAPCFRVLRGLLGRGPRQQDTAHNFPVPARAVLGRDALGLKARGDPCVTPSAPSPFHHAGYGFLLLWVRV